MTDPLYELLVPYFDTHNPLHPVPHLKDNVTAKYLERIPTLSLASLTTTEPQSLAQYSHSNSLSLLSLSARSNAAIVASSDHLSNLRADLTQVGAEAEALRNAIPKLNEAAVAFSEKYSKSSQNEVLDRRKKALLMARNVDRLSDILDLPTLLSSAISSSSTTAQGAPNASNYSAALDLYSHIKRLHLLYRDSDLVSSIYQQTEEAMEEMTSSLISSLRAPNIKLAAAMRTIGWLRRVAPQLDGSSTAREGGSLGTLFLVCRLTTLVSTLSALEPLRDLADQETSLRLRAEPNIDAHHPARDAWSHGQQTERYLKRYIEIFREQSFAILSMYRSIFPPTPDLPTPGHLASNLTSLDLKSPLTQRIGGVSQALDPLTTPPSAHDTFPPHLLNLLSTTLKQYLPNVRDKLSRESLLTQVLYCAGSLGRLGGDFSLLLADLGVVANRDNGNEDAEWVMVMKKHRALASKLEKMASGTT
ncbi:MAG: hypothetical protein Q9163_006006 [Psora crenata]